ncbi:Auxin Efflux Carrier family protein [Trichomonas vaginalis G3]|uniref:Auxin Efflux Carrier family protein n=1 Tax=Trichomonas vaginalis (strain ATCC PRA-98 / G3) TaxID=412133 RepID=A2E0W0_TRIV3|nr:intracellular auxin transport [Trichomonas vaginalis G3]EAY13715.1 Auxin Efflux Carrier family protein [Trichomonas vaginalis G3]KAI5529647.1 intracellular auxin transport [Trichomonas vaginalis G3]|eukprot:XP_001325938.1 Auxin Efflux Carrier family protein [Trichomonas vaginalis G3]
MAGSFYVDIIQVGVSMILIIAIGYILSWLQLFDADGFKAMNAFSAKICFPFLLFRSMASRPFKEISVRPLYNALLSSASSQIVLLVIFFFKFDDRLYTYLSTVISSCYINYIILGLPIFTSIWGNNYNQIPAISSFCHYILLVPLFIINSQLWKIKKEKEELFKKQQLEGGKNADVKLQKLTWKDVVMAFWTAVKTPLVVGNIIGIIWSAIGIPFPPFFKKLSDYVGDGITLFALLGIGRFLQQKSLISCHWFQLLSCLVVRFFIFPGFSFLWSYVFKFPNRIARQCLVLSMLPAANAGFILANSVGIGANVASAMVFWSLIFLVPVLLLWFYILDHYDIFHDDLSDIEKT